MNATYDFSNPIFRKKREYLRWAKEHMELDELNRTSDVIICEVKEREDLLDIPVKYHLHFDIPSIIGIKEDESPIYGRGHILEIEIPPSYPKGAPLLYMRTDIWHPNIKSEGKFKGRVCSNAKNFGLNYTLYQLVLRVAEMLQYKNYHAENIWPFPEDSVVAAWVKDYAEPNGIVNKEKGLSVDETILLRGKQVEDNEVVPEEPEGKPKMKIRIKKTGRIQEPKKKIRINKKGNNKKD